MPITLIQMCSWSNPEILKVSIESLLTSIQGENVEIAVCLNEGDKESIEFLIDKGIYFWYSPVNWGTLGVDFTLPLSLKCNYVCNVNDDFLFYKGWVTDLIDIIETYYPCSASCSLVEKIHTNNPVVSVDDLGEFLDPNTRIKFEENMSNGIYTRPSRMISYTHPIMVKTNDYFSVGGYSNWLDIGFWPGFGLDDYYPYRLWKLHNEQFRFIASNKSFVYHGMSMTNKKLDKSQHGDGWNYFISKTGMNIHQFRQKINCFSLV